MFKRDDDVIKDSVKYLLKLYGCDVVTSFIQQKTSHKVESTHGKPDLKRSNQDEVKYILTLLQLYIASWTSLHSTV